MHAVRRWSSIWLILLSALFFCQSCSKEASFEPLFGLNPGDRFRSDTLVAEASAWFNRGKSAGPGWNSSRMVVCHWEGYESRGFLRFTAFPDTEVTVSSAQLYLYADRVEGDAGGVSLDIHTLSDTLIQTGLYWSGMPGLSEEPIAGFTVPDGPGDSVMVDITGIVTSWVKKEGRNYGLAIKPREDDGPAFLVEFATREVPTKTTIAAGDTTILDLRPALRIAYVDTAGTPQRAVSIAAVDVFADTLLTPFPPDDLHLLCGSGFPSRSFVRFDLEQIPEGATVTRSIMSLSIDGASSSFDSMGVKCHAVTKQPWEGFDTAIGAVGTSTITIEADTLETGSATVAFDITPLVQPLVARQEANSGFAVKASNEAFDLDFMRFWSHTQPDEALRPRLVVDYVIPPELPYSEVERQ